MPSRVKTVIALVCLIQAAALAGPPLLTMPRRILTLLRPRLSRTYRTIPE
jgi:hypothetical protein